MVKMKQLYFPGAKPVKFIVPLHVLQPAPVPIYMHVHVQLFIMVRTDDIRTERVKEEILPGRKVFSMQQIHQLLYY